MFGGFNLSKIIRSKNQTKVKKLEKITKSHLTTTKSDSQRIFDLNECGYYT